MSVSCVRYAPSLAPKEKAAAVTKVRCLDHELFDGDHVSRELSREAAEAVMVELNQLRTSLGWLEVDVQGHWRWPHDSAS